MVKGFWQCISLGKSFYRESFEPVRRAFDLSVVELDILMFLACAHESNTAGEITRMRGIAKSNVSTAVQRLTACGYIEGRYEEGNRRSIHLYLLEKSRPVLEAAAQAQQEFFSVLFSGFSEDELNAMNEGFRRLVDNIENAKKKRQ